MARENYRRQLKRIHVRGFLRGEAVDHYYDYINMRPRRLWRRAFDPCAIAPKARPLRSSKCRDAWKMPNGLVHVIAIVRLLCSALPTCEANNKWPVDMRHTAEGAVVPICGCILIAGHWLQLRPLRRGGGLARLRRDAPPPCAARLRPRAEGCVPEATPWANAIFIIPPP